MKSGTMFPGRAHHVRLWSSWSLTQSQNVCSFFLLLGKKAHFPLSCKTKDIHPEPPNCPHSPPLHNITSPPFGPVCQVSWQEKVLFKDTTLALAAPGSSLPVFSFSYVSVPPPCLLASLCGLQTQSLSPPSLI